MQAAVAAGYHVLAGNRSAPVDAVIGHDDAVSELRLDVTDADDIARAAALVAEHVGPRGLDALVNVAGIGIPGPLEAMPMDDLRLSLDVDFFGQVALTQPLIPLLRTARGRVVFVGSIIDRVTLPFFGALAAAKAATASAAGTLRQELAPWGIHVILVEPGFISSGADEATKARIDRVAADLPPDEAALYRDMFTTATDRGYSTQTSGTPPEGVAECIMGALTARRPRARYLTGGRARRVAASALLPQRVQDALHRRAFGLPRPGSRGGR